MSIEINTPKEILRDEKIEKIIDNFTQNGLGCKYFECSGDDMEALLKYINKLEESHAYVFDAYQDLGNEHFNFIENIEKELEECEKHKEKYMEEYPGWSCDLECLEDIRVMDAEIRILKSILPEPMEEVIEEALEEMRGE